MVLRVDTPVPTVSHALLHHRNCGPRCTGLLEKGDPAYCEVGAVRVDKRNVDLTREGDAVVSGDRARVAELEGSLLGDMSRQPCSRACLGLPFVAHRQEEIGVAHALHAAIDELALSGEDGLSAWCNANCTPRSSIGSSSLAGLTAELR